MIPGRPGADKASGENSNWRPVASVVLTLALLAGVVVFGPPLIHSFRGRLQHHLPAPLASAPLSPASSTTTPSTATPSTTAPSTAAPSTNNPSTPTLPSTPSAPGSQPGLVVQVVPAVRDVLFNIDGRLAATNDQGVIDLPGLVGKVPITAIGYSVSPALQQVVLDRWSDGSKSLRRTVVVSGATTVELGVTLRYRVLATEPLALGTRRVSAAMFSSSVGALRLPIGVPVWVTAVEAVNSNSGLQPSPVSYHLSAQVVDGTRRPSAHMQFLASPEAIWNLPGAG